MLKIISFKIILLIIFNVLTSSKGDECVQKGPCVCVFPNGTGIDLTPTEKQTEFYVAQGYEPNSTIQYKLINYYFHPCFDALPPVNTSGSNNTCNKELSLCRHLFTLTYNSKISAYESGNDRCEYLGTSTKTYFSSDAKSLIVNNGPTNNTVLTVCSQGDDRLHVYSSNPPDVVLAFYSRHACLKQIEAPGRSVGSTLLIVFFSLVIFYLVLGICTKKFLMGATGIEVIPNLAFWSDLPNLVKDGWAFAANGFKLPPRAGQMSSPDPNSYDSI